MNRIALVIGNSNYIQLKPLRNPKNDAEDIANVLVLLGFEVIKVLDGTHTQIMLQVKEFVKKAVDYSATFFYFAGHGIQMDGNNYIIPVDFTYKDKTTAILNSYCMNDYLKDIGLYHDKTNIIVLDSCRDNPFPEESRGFIRSGFTTFAQAPKGCFISFSTSPDSTASDGIGSNGLYTGLLKEYIKTPNIQIEETFKMVRSKLDKLSGGTQMSWEHSSLIGEFYFHVTELSVDVNQTEIYNYIKSQGDKYEASNSKDIYEIECLPFIDAQKKYRLSIIELSRLYSKESYSRTGQRFPDGDIDEINIRYLSSWGFVNKNFRWYFRDQYVIMGDPLPLDQERLEKSPIYGNDIEVNFQVKCIFVEDRLVIEVQHNLPDKTILMFSLRNKKQNYYAQSKTNCESSFARSEGFSNKGNKLSEGMYQLNISSPINNVQDDSIKSIFGEENRNLTGKYVKHSPIMGKTIDGHFTLIIDGNNVKVFDE